MLALPLLVLLYLWLLRRKKKLALRYASLSIVKEAMGTSQSVRRHIPPLLFLLAIAAMLFAASRPFAVVSLPMTQETIILAMDVSGSMRATDVKPNRLVAAQNAAKAFLAELPRNVKVGIVAFAGSAQVVQPPTLSREDLVAAIDRSSRRKASTCLPSPTATSARAAWRSTRHRRRTRRSSFRSRPAPMARRRSSC
jgi:Ca-activated chloride channel family protein